MGFSRQEHWSGLPFPSPMHNSEKWKGSRSVVSDSSQPHGLQPTRLLRPWDFPGKSTGVGCHCLLCRMCSRWPNTSTKDSIYIPNSPVVVAVQSLSRVQLFVIPWAVACQASLSSPSPGVCWFMSIESLMLSNHLILYCPLLLLPSIFPGI